MDKIDIKSLTLLELTDILLEEGLPSFRGKQVYDWLHKKLSADFEEMTNLPKKMQQMLAEKCILTALKPVEVLTSDLDGTKKYLFRLEDGNVIESVLMKYHHGNSICISSQAGCRMGCRFCASTIDGLSRNLTAAEMLDQIYFIQKDIGERISNVVVMGSGEPLDNYENLIRFIRILSDEQGLHISQRNITVSTCGLVPEIYRLGEEGFSITLALSLHAATDEVRRELMPIASRYSIAEVLKACRWYFGRTGRRLTFEYSLVKDVNDHGEEAKRLVQLLKGFPGHINLIPVNPIEERDYCQSKDEAILEFKKILEKNNMNVTIRREMGRDINGACGQLRKSFIDKGEK